MHVLLVFRASRPPLRRPRPRPQVDPWPHLPLNCRHQLVPCHLPFSCCSFSFSLQLLVDRVSQMLEEQRRDEFPHEGACFRLILPDLLIESEALTADIFDLLQQRQFRKTQV